MFNQEIADRQSQNHWEYMVYNLEYYRRRRNRLKIGSIGSSINDKEDDEDDIPEEKTPCENRED
jgi:hypothetical protein